MSDVRFPERIAVDHDIAETPRQTAPVPGFLSPGDGHPRPRAGRCPRRRKTCQGCVYLGGIQFQPGLPAMVDTVIRCAYAAAPEPLSD